MAASRKLARNIDAALMNLNQALDEDYPTIASRAKLEGAEIHWGDETGLRSDDVGGRSFAPQG